MPEELILFYHRDGTPYTGPRATEEWAIDFEYMNRIIVQTQLWNGFFVPTIFTGIDNNVFHHGAPPLIFESMVFRGRSGGLDEDHYATEAEAKAGHEKMVSKWSGLRPLIKYKYEQLWGYILQYAAPTIVRITVKRWLQQRGTKDS